MIYGTRHPCTLTRWSKKLKMIQMVEQQQALGQVLLQHMLPVGLLLLTGYHFSTLGYRMHTLIHSSLHTFQELLSSCRSLLMKEVTFQLLQRWQIQHRTVSGWSCARDCMSICSSKGASMWLSMHNRQLRVASLQPIQSNNRTVHKAGNANLWTLQPIQIKMKINMRKCFHWLGMVVQQSQQQRKKQLWHCRRKHSVRGVMAYSIGGESM